MVAGVGLAITVYIIVLLSVGAIVCDGDCEEALGIALLAGVAGLITLLVSTGLFLRQTSRWFRER